MKKFIFTLLFLTMNLLSAQDGTLDISFNSTGSISTLFDVYDSSVHSIVLQDDGKIIAGGTVFNEGDYSQFALARYNNDGTPDISFGNDGVVVGDLINRKISLNSVALQSDGKILAQGIVYNNYEDSQFILSRFNTDGTLDTTFGVDGVVIVDFLNVNALIVQPDNKIVVAGFSFETADRDFIIIRFNADGSVDPSFGTNGLVTTSLTNKDFVYDVTLQSDGKIVLAGSIRNLSGEFNSDFVVARYFDDGNIDTAFGVNGFVVLDQDEIDEARSVNIQTDGKIVFTGWSYSVTNFTAVYKIIRLLPNGDLDPSFGAGGIVDSSLLLSTNENLIQIQTDSKILVAGAFETGGVKSVALLRLLEDGSLDLNFGVSGIVITPEGTERSSRANSVVIQPDNKILIGGETGEASLSYHPNFVIKRYNSGLE